MTGTADTPCLDRRFPTITGILGEKKFIKVFQQLTRSGKDAAALFHQAENDLCYLNRRLDIQRLQRAYRAQLADSNQTIQTVHEVYAAALLASVSDDIELHAPGRDGKNCDFRIKICGCEIYGDVKTRHDRFPFNTPPRKDYSGEDLYLASRATVDYRVDDRTPPDEIDRSTPESGELREIIIEDTLPKLPETKPNLIVLGLVGAFDSPLTTREHLMAAAFGDAYDLFRDGKHISSRYRNGIFTDPICGKEITSIAWLCLKRSSRGLIRRSGVFFNSNATNTLPEEVKLALERVFDRERCLRRELEIIVKKLKREYRPQKIILFGSLAQGGVKEGSDIDLVVIKETDSRPLDRCLEIAALVQPSMAVNFLVYTPEEFQREEKAGNFFVVEEIIKKGQVLYER